MLVFHICIVNLGGMVIPMAAGYPNNTNTFLPCYLHAIICYIFLDNSYLSFFTSKVRLDRCCVVRFLLSQCCDYTGPSLLESTRGSRPLWFPIQDFFCDRVRRFSARILVGSIFCLELPRSCLILQGYRRFSNHLI